MTLKPESESTDRLFPIFVKEGRSRKRWKAGYINRLGQVVIPPTFDHAYPFREGFASVRQKDLWGAINIWGDLVIPFAYGAPLVFNEGLATFSLADKAHGYREGLISTKGEIVMKPRYRAIGFFSSGLAYVSIGQPSGVDSLYGFIDSGGNQVIPPFFEEARTFSEGVASVRMNGVWGYINPDASTAVPFRFICNRGMAGPFRQGLARVARDGKWGHIDRSGTFVIEPRFDLAYEFTEGLAEIELNKLRGYVNTVGDLVIPPKFRHAQRFCQGLAAVNVGTGEAHKSIAEACETGFINPQVEFVIQPKFFSAGSFYGGICLVETEKELMYIDQKGDVIWASGWCEVLNLDPLHLLPPEP